jgi:hypothetical protein
MRTTVWLLAFLACLWIAACSKEVGPADNLAELGPAPQPLPAREHGAAVELGQPPAAQLSGSDNASDESLTPWIRDRTVAPERAVVEGADQETLGWEETLRRMPLKFENILGKEFRYADTLCVANMNGKPAVQLIGRVSEAGSGGHAQKVYVLAVKDAAAFLKGDVQPIGQTIVKVTWKEASPNSRIPGEAGPLFVMHRMDEATEGTDRGWLYAVLNADGSEIHHAGRIRSCMGCHEDAPVDRVFGLPESHKTLREDPKVPSPLSQ